MTGIACKGCTIVYCAVITKRSQLGKGIKAEHLAWSETDECLSWLCKHHNTCLMCESHV